MDLIEELAADQRGTGQVCGTCAWLRAQGRAASEAFALAFENRWTTASIHRAMVARGFGLAISSVEKHRKGGHRP